MNLGRDEEEEERKKAGERSFGSSIKLKIRSRVCCMLISFWYIVDDP